MVKTKACCKYHMSMCLSRSLHTIDILDRVKTDNIAQDAAKRAIRASLTYLGVKRATVTELVFVSKKEIRSLNTRCRAINNVTDVLSFPSIQPEHLTVLNSKGKGRVFLGSIVICVPRALEQATHFGHSPTREFAFLATHSVLHLLGYDHGNVKDETRMRMLQRKILYTAGFSLKASGRVKV